MGTRSPHFQGWRRGKIRRRCADPAHEMNSNSTATGSAEKKLLLPLHPLETVAATAAPAHIFTHMKPHSNIRCVLQVWTSMRPHESVLAKSFQPLPCPQEIGKPSTASILKSWHLDKPSHCFLNSSRIILLSAKTVPAYNKICHLAGAHHGWPLLSQCNNRNGLDQVKCSRNSRSSIGGKDRYPDGGRKPAM